MRFVVIAATVPIEVKDRDVPTAPPRSSRTVAPYVESGQVLLGGAILDETGDMVGSVMLTDFPTREGLDEWLAGDPYVTGGVWRGSRFSPTVRPWVPGSPAIEATPNGRIRPDC